MAGREVPGREEVGGREGGPAGGASGGPAGPLGRVKEVENIAGRGKGSELSRRPLGFNLSRGCIGNFCFGPLHCLRLQWQLAHRRGQPVTRKLNIEFKAT